FATFFRRHAWHFVYKKAEIPGKRKAGAELVGHTRPGLKLFVIGRRRESSTWSKGESRHA
ncbi:MAG: hypothetical protein AB7P49_15655, partial [Bdellovibrionales bacterium]